MGKHFIPSKSNDGMFVQLTDGSVVTCRVLNRPESIFYNVNEKIKFLHIFFLITGCFLNCIESIYGVFSDCQLYL
jgi:hypothetical protein